MTSSALRLTEWVISRIILLGLFLALAWGILLGYMWVSPRIRAEVPESATVLMVLLGLSLVGMVWAAFTIGGWYDKKRGF